jgi:RES domain-containing protein
VAGTGRRSVAGIWWRQVRHGLAPLDRTAPPSDGRWQHGAIVEAIYFADEAETAWAEWYRFLSEIAVPPMQNMPRDLWRWKVDAEAVADLSSVEKLADAALPVPQPQRSSWKPFQEYGENLYAEGFQGILAPSAARPGHDVLCLFRSRGSVIGASPLPPPELYTEPPPPPTGMTT